MLITIYVLWNPKFDRPFCSTSPPSKEQLAFPGTRAFKFNATLPIDQVAEVPHSRLEELTK